MTAVRLLLVEDSPTLRERLRDWLTAGGWTVDEAADGEAALAFLAAYEYQLVLLDLGLPGIDGQEVITRMRAAGSSARVLVLSARDQIDERVAALNRGADDYLIKPFALEELASRLLALMRRSLDGAPAVLRQGALEVDPAVRVARVDGAPLALTPKEYLLLEALLRHRGQLMTRPKLFELLYDSRSDASDKVIEVLISTLRAKLARAGITDFIETRRGFGYVVA
ncbi:MAG: response regulator transcription factor [Gammaproteobacteria bacterium]